MLYFVPQIVSPFWLWLVSTTCARSGSNMACWFIIVQQFARIIYREKHIKLIVIFLFYFTQFWFTVTIYKVNNWRHFKRCDFPLQVCKICSSMVTFFICSDFPFSSSDALPGSKYVEPQNKCFIWWVLICFTFSPSFSCLLIFLTISSKRIIIFYSRELSKFRTEGKQCFLKQKFIFDLETQFAGKYY